MAKELIHVIDEKLFHSGWFSNEKIRTVRYGKCLKSPYLENSLWFVTISMGVSGYDLGEHTPKDAAEPRTETTFLVTEQYAHPYVIDDFKRDIEKWEKIAYKVLVGEWCSPLEQTWQDVPIYTHILPNMAKIKYGYCRSQDDLWFVSFKDTASNSDDHTFIVDEVCAQPEFMNYLGTDAKKWASICWCYLRHEIKWDDLKTGVDSKGIGYYVLENQPSSQKIALYQQEMKNVR